MKVYTLTGKSGTGKSYQALNLCKEKNIESIIDDGLFIYHNRVEAGISAKRQETMVGAIKTALFTLDEHAWSVAEKIKELNPETLLIIGTSDRMTDRIVARLGLPDVSERVYIEDITTEAERETATRQRQDFGKHVIPAPTLQLKRTFAGYFMDPLSIIKGLNLCIQSSNSVLLFLNLCKEFDFLPYHRADHLGSPLQICDKEFVELFLSITHNVN